MRGAVVNIIVEYLVAGHNVTVMCGRPEKMRCVKRKVLDALDDLGAKTIDLCETKVVVGDNIQTSPWFQLGQLQHYSGGAVQHSPLLVLQDVHLANTCLLPDARAIACKFLDGKPPIIIEC